jgi:hypothetical protein
VILTARPHIGFGVAKPGAEAQALAEALADKPGAQTPL